MMNKETPLKAVSRRDSAVQELEQRKAALKKRLITDEELEDLPDPQWLIDKCLPDGSLGLLYSKPGVGKTFLALDWVLSISSDRAWFDRRVNTGFAVYVAAEGLGGLKKRRTAWKQARGITRCPNVRYFRGSVRLRDPDEVRAFIALIQDSLGRDVRLIVFDTLARCVVGADENSAKDMGEIVASVDLIREQTGAAVLLVHHATKSKEGPVVERGSSAISGAADVIVSLTENFDVIRLTCEKQKDDELFDPISLSLRQIDIGGDASSCVVDLAPERGSKAAWTTGHETVLNTLRSFPNMTSTTKALVTKTGLPSRSFHRTMNDLVDWGKVEKPRIGHYSIRSEEPDASATALPDE